jgi:hypothetical protein
MSAPTDALTHVAVIGLFDKEREVKSALDLILNTRFVTVVLKHYFITNDACYF